MPGLGAPPGGPADCTSASEELHLPDAVVKNIANYAVLNEAPGHALLNLLVMCGVCRQWRSVARDVNPGVCLGYDGLDNTFSQQTSVQRFRRLSHDKKEQLFVSAAGLFTGYTEASFAGDGVSDRLLLLVAERAGCRLTRIRIQSSSGVTDHGLSALIAKAPKLQHLALEDLSKSITGNFMVRLFQGCPKMLTLHLANIPHLSWAPCKSACAPWREQPTTKLVARGVGLDADFGAILCKMPHVTDLDLDGPARNVKAASLCCPKLQRVSYQVSCRPQLDEALAALMNTKGIKQLELIIKNFILTSDQLRVIGMLPVVDLRLDSFIYKQQPTLSRSSYSHVDNEGVKALVDSICNRWCALGADMKPLKLSLCGATSLTHDAVSALLRLPILTELDINGCCRITAMDKMRLVAKVRAGREMLESGRRPSMRSSRFPGLML